MMEHKSGAPGRAWLVLWKICYVKAVAFAEDHPTSADCYMRELDWKGL